MENLISVVNRLQCVFESVGTAMELPQIVSVGSQSSGKSSVIESILAADILPRGTGLVTRCPVILQLHRVDEKDIPFENVPPSYSQWVTIHNEPDVFLDFTQVRTKVEEIMNKKGGGIKSIHKDPIIIQFYSPNVVDLTLVDLPGLTKLPVKGQPDDIEVQVRELVLKYIINPNSIILAVTAANTDFATSESLKLAKEVDPEGVRTLAVLTKLDTVEEDETDATEVLRGEAVSVKLGIIGVINRNQKRIKANESIEAAREYERNYLKSRYPNLAETNGSVYLVGRLSTLLRNHIKTRLPDLRERLVQLERSQRLEIKKAPTFDQLIEKFSNLLKNKIIPTSETIETSRLETGARIGALLQRSFKTALEAMDPLAGVDRVAIEKAVLNSVGLNRAISVNQTVFEHFARRQIKAFGPVVSECSALVLEELLKASEEASNSLSNLPEIADRLKRETRSIFQTAHSETVAALEEFIEIQLSLVNVADMDIPTKVQHSSDTRATRRFKTLFSPKKEVQYPTAYEIVEEWVTAYFQRQASNFLQNVPNYIKRYLIDLPMEQLHSQLIASLRGENVLSEFEEKRLKYEEIANKTAEAISILDDTMKSILPEHPLQ